METTTRQEAAEKLLNTVRTNIKWLLTPWIRGFGVRWKVFFYAYLMMLQSEFKDTNIIKNVSSCQLDFYSQRAKIVISKLLELSSDVSVLFHLNVGKFSSAGTHLSEIHLKKKQVFCQTLISIIRRYRSVWKNWCHPLPLLFLLLLLLPLVTWWAGSVYLGGKLDVFKILFDRWTEAGRAIRSWTMIRAVIPNANLRAENKSFYKST